MVTVDPHASLLFSSGNSCPEHPDCSIIGDQCVCALEGISVEATAPPPPTPPPLYPAAPGWTWPSGGGAGSPAESCPPGPITEDCSWTATLSCPINVVRGNTGTCSFSMDPSWALQEITSWGFQGDNVATSLVANTQTWQGTLIESGQVRVEFRAVNGSIGVVVANLGVIPRTWSWSSANRTFAQGVPGDLDNCMPSGAAGLTADKFGCTFANPAILINPAVGKGFTISRASGPNANGWYVTNPTTRTDLRTQLAREFRSDAPGTTLNGVSSVVQACSSAYLPLPVPPQNDFSINTTCFQTVGFSAFTAFIWSHEGAHLSAVQQEAVKPSSDFYAAWEPVVRSDSAVAFSLANQAQNGIHQAFLAAGISTHTGDSTSFSFFSRIGSGYWDWGTFTVHH